MNLKNSKPFKGVSLLDNYVCDEETKKLLGKGYIRENTIKDFLRKMFFKLKHRRR